MQRARVIDVELGVELGQARLLYARCRPDGIVDVATDRIAFVQNEAVFRGVDGVWSVDQHGYKAKRVVSLDLRRVREVMAEDKGDLEVVQGERDGSGEG